MSLAISDDLSSESVADVKRGLVSLDELLLTLVPSIRKLRSTGIQDTRLAEFCVAQDNFQLNLASSLLSACKTLSGTDLAEAHILVANRQLQGLLLIHPPSRNVFGRRSAMQTMLAFLDPNHPQYLVAICISCVSLFIHILIKNTANMRMFEECGGPLQIIHYLQYTPQSQGEPDQTLRFKAIEFLIFYLGDESEQGPSQGRKATTLTTQQKADLLRPGFPGINELIENLNDLASL